MTEINYIPNTDKAIDNITPEQTERFWSYVDKGEPDECWNWTMGLFNHGYGKYKVGSMDTVCSAVQTHRLAYTLSKGKIIEGLHVLHSCDNPKCCNPRHLSLGTDKDNQRHRGERGRTGYTGSKLTEEIVANIKQLLVNGVFQQQIADDVGVSLRSISSISIQQHWQGVPFPTNRTHHRRMRDFC